MMLFSWRLFQTTGDGKYIDNIENELYNGILSGISIDGRDFFYTEALRRTKEFPYVMRWPKHRQHYITCFCCPPNTLRTLCQAQEYAYTLGGSSADTLYVNLYGQNSLKTKDLEISQETNYPWDGEIKLTVKKAKKLSTIILHKPDWCDKYSVKVNGDKVQSSMFKGQISISRKWKKGDVIELCFDMRPRLIEANPLVEEAKNQVAVMRGPIVYCLEGQDIEGGYRINDSGTTRPSIASSPKPPRPRSRFASSPTTPGTTAAFRTCRSGYPSSDKKDMKQILMLWPLFWFVRSGRTAPSLKTAILRNTSC